MLGLHSPLFTLISPILILIRRLQEGRWLFGCSQASSTSSLVFFPPGSAVLNAIRRLFRRVHATFVRRFAAGTQSASLK